jgi:hypothetical protein
VAAPPLLPPRIRVLPLPTRHPCVRMPSQPRVAATARTQPRMHGHEGESSDGVREKRRMSE